MATDGATWELRLISRPLPRARDSDDEDDEGQIPVVVGQGEKKKQNDAAGSHIRNQQQVSAELLRDEDPTRFAHRREICPGHQALKNGPTISTSCYAHVCLLKAGKSEIGLHNPLLDLARRHRRCLSRRTAERTPVWHPV
ncbi:hypothetical protein OC846_006577 [Tilletia horrida]|uniref:Uncharacterized protein n=1 Tax=Tilletia horrida TaxID=155126 RepID=A0AAN6GIG3_9BASI|nr:hypothetical protein OC846_006577 [Tilletia horrida]KAK0559387.1 hypothetical protein OC861_006662 [Tilletia horrida]